MNLKTAIDIKFPRDTITFYWKTREELLEQIDSLISRFSALFNGKLSNANCVADYILALDSVRVYKSDIGKIGFYSASEKRNIFISEINLDTYPFEKEFKDFVLNPQIEQELSKEGSFVIELSKSELNELLSLAKFRTKQIDRIVKI